MEDAPPRLPVEAFERCPAERDMLGPMLNAERIVLAQNDHKELAKYMIEQRGAPNSLWREKVSLWMFDVADHLHERRSIVYFAMNILDRYCIASHKIKRVAMCEGSYEKASLAAIFLAVRIAGSAQVHLHDIIRMSRRGVSSQQLIESGTDMVHQLSWATRLVTPHEFISALVTCLPSSERHSAILDGASYLSELAVCDVYLARHKASDVALAALLNTLTADGGGDLSWTVQTIRESTPMDPDSQTIREVRNRLHRLYSLSYESIGLASPHIISCDDDDDSPRGFISSCATRTVSEEDLVALSLEAEVPMHYDQKRPRTLASSGNACTYFSK